MKAYTLGLTNSYDMLLVVQDRPMKLGACSKEDMIERFGICEPEYESGYPGGWVWQTFEEADSFRKEHLKKFFTAKPEDFSVYELELPDTWEKCTKPGENCSHIQMDVLIVKKVQKNS